MLNIVFIVLTAAAVTVLLKVKKIRPSYILLFWCSAVCAAALLTALNGASGFIFTDLYGFFAAAALLAALVGCLRRLLLRELSRFGRLKRKKEAEEKNSAA